MMSDPNPGPDKRGAAIARKFTASTVPVIRKLRTKSVRFTTAVESVGLEDVWVWLAVRHATIAATAIKITTTATRAVIFRRLGCRGIRIVAGRSADSISGASSKSFKVFAFDLSAIRELSGFG